MATDVRLLIVILMILISQQARPFLVKLCI